MTITKFGWKLSIYYEAYCQRKSFHHTFNRIGGSTLLNIWRSRPSKLWLHMHDFTIVSALANSKRSSETLSRYSLATSASNGDSVWERNPEEVWSPCLAFNTPEPDISLEDVEAATSLGATDPSLFRAALTDPKDLEPRFPYSLLRWATSS